MTPTQWGLHAEKITMLTSPMMSLVPPSTVSHALMWGIHSSSSGLTQSYPVCSGRVLTAKGKWPEGGPVTSPQAPHTPPGHRPGRGKAQKETGSSRAHRQRGRLKGVAMTGPHRCASETVMPPPNSAPTRLGRMRSSQSWNVVIGSGW